MARPKTLKGSKVLIELGDGGSPSAVFDALCALSAKGVKFSAETNDFNVPDCDDPDAPSWTERVVGALSAGVTGSGTLAMESLATWRAWFLTGTEKNIRVKLDAAPGDGGGYFAMSAVLSGLNVSGNQGELAQIEVTIASNGEVTWVPAS